MRQTFDYIAPYYDFLAATVYGSHLKNAKCAFLDLLPAKGHVLLMGGGTGNILNELLLSHGELTIDFVDASEKMLQIAEKNLKPEFRSQVNFIPGDHRSVPRSLMYDGITSFFVIDCLKQEEALEFVQLLISQLKTDGTWLFADFFRTENIFQRGLLWFMYRFFKVVAGISAGQLPDYNSIFESSSLQEIACKKFLDGFIESRAYRNAKT